MPLLAAYLLGLDMERKPDPSWAHPAPEGVQCALEAVKGGVVVGQLVLSGQSLSGASHSPSRLSRGHLLGRSPLCDFVLDHESISRQHAFVGWDRDGKLLVADLNSAHGTTVEQRALRPGMTVELKDGSTIAFGASSRSYVVKLRTVADIEAEAAENEAEKLKGSVQEYRRLCILRLCTTCDDDGLASSATFGPPEVVRISAVLLDTERPVPLGTLPRVLGTFSTLCRPTNNPLLSRKCRELAQCAQEEIDQALSVLHGLTSFMEWLAQNGALGGDGERKISESHHNDEDTEKSIQKPIMVVTLGESAIKRHLPRECVSCPPPPLHVTRCRQPPLMRYCRCHCHSSTKRCAGRHCWKNGSR